jgi:uncharacterized protein YbjT (DUF2867 family)
LKHYASIALSAKYFSGVKVTALVRDLSRLPEDIAPKINVINGNSTIKEDVLKAVEGQDAIIVTLGTRHELGKQVFLNITFIFLVF